MFPHISWIDSRSSYFIFNSVCIFQLAKLQSFCVLDICHSIQPGRRSPCVASSLHCRQSICEGVTDIWWFKLQKWSRTNYERLGSAQRFWAEMTLPLEPCRFWWTLGATRFPMHKPPQDIAPQVLRVSYHSGQWSANLAFPDLKWKGSGSSFSLQTLKAIGAFFEM